MSINVHHRYFQNAHRVSDYPIDPSVTALEDGQWLMLNADRKLVISDGSARSYLTTSSIKLGRNTVKESGKAVILVGPYRVETDQWDRSATYAIMDPLKVNANGVVTKFVVGTDTRFDLIVGYVTKVPQNADDTIEFIHE